MLRHLALPLTLLAVTACAADSQPLPESDFEQEDSSEVIEYRVPEAPVVAQWSEEANYQTQFSIAFGHCEDEEVAEDGSIEINCPQKWSEVYWLEISAEDSAALLQEGYTHFEIDGEHLSSSAEGDTPRISVHRTTPEGKEKLLSVANWSEGETLTLPLQEDSSYQVYLARGANRHLVWHRGHIELSLSLQASQAD